MKNIKTSIISGKGFSWDNEMAVRITFRMVDKRRSRYGIFSVKVAQE